ncbi:MAG: DnaB-like helicase N-terminal domain-containing protein, partial [Betaproteobacteria bacterium]
MPNDPQLEALKVPPHSIEAEQSVLGGLLLDNGAIDRIADVMSDSDFYNDAHRLIYQHINLLSSNGKPADVITLCESLGSVQKLEYVGGMPYVGALAQNVPSAANIRTYAQIVRERAVLRKLAAVGTDITDSAFIPMGRSAAQLLDEAEAKVFDIAEQGSRGQTGFQEIRPLLTKVVERIEE